MADEYREVVYREIDIDSNNVTMGKKIIWNVNVKCPYCGGKCSYTFDDIRFKKKEVICNDGPECGRTFFLHRKGK